MKTATGLYEFCWCLLLLVLLFYVHWSEISEFVLVQAGMRFGNLGPRMDSCWTNGEITQNFWFKFRRNCQTIEVIHSSSNSSGEGWRRVVPVPGIDWERCGSETKMVFFYSADFVCCLCIMNLKELHFFHLERKWEACSVMISMA